MGARSSRTLSTPPTVTPTVTRSLFSFQRNRREIDTQKTGILVTSGESIRSREIIKKLYESKFIETLNISIKALVQDPFSEEAQEIADRGCMVFKGRISGTANLWLAMKNVKLAICVIGPEISVAQDADTTICHIFNFGVLCKKAGVDKMIISLNSDAVRGKDTKIRQLYKKLKKIRFRDGIFIIKTPDFCFEDFTQSLEYDAKAREAVMRGTLTADTLVPMVSAESIAQAIVSKVSEVYKDAYTFKLLTASAKGIDEAPITPRKPQKESETQSETPADTKRWTPKRERVAKMSPLKSKRGRKAKMTPLKSISKKKFPICAVLKQEEMTIEQYLSRIYQITGIRASYQQIKLGDRTPVDVIINRGNESNGSQKKVSKSESQKNETTKTPQAKDLREDDLSRSSEFTRWANDHRESLRDHIQMYNGNDNLEDEDDQDESREDPMRLIQQMSASSANPHIDFLRRAAKSISESRRSARQKSRQFKTTDFTVSENTVTSGTGSMRVTMEKIERGETPKATVPKFSEWAKPRFGIHADR